MRDRTADLLRARQALSQLSYSPVFFALLVTDFVVSFRLKLDKKLSQTVLNTVLFIPSTLVKVDREEVYWSKRRPV